MLPPEQRIPEVRALVDGAHYFVLHAPRQVGKTTALLSLGRELTAEGRYAAVLVSMEVGAPFSDDPGAAELAILGAWRGAAEARLPADLLPPPWPEAAAGQRLLAALRAWARASRLPLVLFLDEIDAIANEALISVLRQLRDGYADRPGAFPHALALIGLRDLRDYKVASGGSARLNTASPFNIKAESLTMRGFTPEEVRDLFAQHTHATGQDFTNEAVGRVFELTQGQPWLVNALARQCVEKLVPDRALAVTPADIDRAKHILIQRQDTHLDSLAERLREPRVRRIIEPILAGLALPNVPADDVRFVQDIGLVCQSAEGGLEMANPIYAEVVPASLAYVTRASLPRIAPTWLRADGSLDEGALLDAFEAFWRQHGEPLLGSAPYHEIAPHLVLMAFLHRVANAGGTVEREYAIGRGRMDLCLRYGGQTIAMELKVWRDGAPDPRNEGLAQLDSYLSGLGLDAGWLIIFDRRAGQPPVAERTHTESAATPAGRAVTVIRA